jgi:hypothetical protein
MILVPLPQQGKKRPSEEVGSSQEDLQKDISEPKSNKIGQLLNVYWMFCCRGALICSIKYKPNYNTPHLELLVRRKREGCQLFGGSYVD